MKILLLILFLNYFFYFNSLIYFPPYGLNNSLSSSSSSSHSHSSFQNISIYYFVITGNEMFERVKIVWNTWGKTIKKEHFNILSDSLFDKKLNLPVIKVMNISKENSMSVKYRLSQLKWLYGIQLMKNKEFDWIVFLDDDTFIINYSLEILLSQYNSSKSLLIGKAGEPSCHLVCGGAGFAMSKSLVSKLNNEFYYQFDKEYHSIIDSNSTHFHSDVIISNFIHKHKIGTIIHREEFKNFPPEVGMKWYQLHNRTPSAVVTYHRLTIEDYKLFYSIYYNTFHQSIK